MFSHSYFAAPAFSPSYFPPESGTAPAFLDDGINYAWDVFGVREREPVFPVRDR